MEQNNDRKRLWQDLSYSNIGIELPVAILIGTLIGYKLDEHFDTSPWLILLGFFLGTAAGFLSVYKLLIVKEKNNGQKKKRDREKT